MTQTFARHRRLIVPFAVVLGLFAVWTVWWFWLAGQVERRVDLAAEAVRAQGWTVAYEAPRVTGWPFRVRLETRGFRVAAPTGHAVAAPVLAAQANAYRPDRWVATAPEGLVLTRAEKGEAAVSAPAIRASASGLARPFPNLALELVEPVFVAGPGAEPFPLASAGRIELYLRPSQAPLEPPPEAAPETTLTAQPMTAPGAAAARTGDVDILFRLIDGVGRPGGPIAYMSRGGLFSLQAETVVENFRALSGPDAASLMAAWSARGGRFVRTRGEMRAGDSAATLFSEALAADENGRLTGVVALSADQAAPALSGLARSEGVNRPAAVGAAVAATASEAMRGDVSLDLEFRDGRAWLGPFNLAPAPELF